MMNKQLTFVIGCQCLLLIGCSLLPESSFELASESRLPRWFTLPSGRSRSEVRVKMDYYLNSVGSTATFLLSDKKGWRLAKVNGKVRDLEPLTRKANPDPRGYPRYEVITVGAVTEVIEHRRAEPIFYITDDPDVLSELVSRAH